MESFYLLDGKKVFLEIPSKKLNNGSYTLEMVRDEDYNLIATFDDRLKPVGDKENEKDNSSG